jgi:hypothetical protein
MPGDQGAPGGGTAAMRLLVLSCAGARGGGRLGGGRAGGVAILMAAGGGERGGGRGDGGGGRGGGERGGGRGEGGGGGAGEGGKLGLLGKAGGWLYDCWLGAPNMMPVVQPFCPSAVIIPAWGGGVLALLMVQFSGLLQALCGCPSIVLLTCD